MNNSFTWIPIYRKLALKIMEYQDNPDELIRIILNTQEQLGLSPESYQGRPMRCIDPLSFFSILEKYNQSNRNRFINRFEEQIGMSIEVPNDYDGIPSTFALEAWLFKNDEDAKLLWNIAKYALKYDETKSEESKNSFIEYYNRAYEVRNKDYRIPNQLFKIAPNTFVNLDSNNRNLIENTLEINLDEFSDGEEYLNICESIKNKIAEGNYEFNNFPEMSHYAWKQNNENTVNTWLISPGENSFLWDDWKENNIISIGWDRFNKDLSEYKNQDDFKDLLKEYYNEDNPVNNSLALYQFVNVMKPGDIVIPKSSRETVLGYGVVVSDYIYDSTRTIHKNIRRVEWKKLGEWNVVKAGSNRLIVKTLMLVNKYPGYAKELMDIINGEEKINDNSSEWIIPANPKYYDHIGSFEKNGFIDWSQNVKFKYNVGDIVYLYTTAPEKRLSAITEVEKIDMSIDEKVDDYEFNKIDLLDKKPDDRNRFIRLKLIKYIDDERLRYDELLAHGLRGNIQSATKVGEELSNYINCVLNGVISSELFDSVNVIYYGGPGCGKSKNVEDNYCNNDNYIRTTFYPDYTNSDFIGQLIPKYDKTKEKLVYKINPGPFTKALEMAYKNTNKNIYLIIEEINRGNAAAIFGDVFQLLDRVTIINDKDIGRKTIGESEYEISNSIIEDYIYEELGKDISGKVKIPPNMSIIATMNTSDQNVYTLDSAFKRRWKMIHITNEFTDEGYDKVIGDKYVPMKNCDIKWKDFVNRINKAIVNINTFGINSEDKQIGKYFVGTSDLLESKINIEEYDSYEPAVISFSEKVLMYLWEDIAKLEPTEWFNENIKTLDDLLKKYITDGVNVFSNNIKDRLNIENVGEVDEQ